MKLLSIAALSTLLVVPCFATTSALALAPNAPFPQKGVPLAPNAPFPQKGVPLAPNAPFPQKGV